jgi:replication factor C small subunit
MTLSCDPSEKVWYRKYKPATVEEIILPSELKQTILSSIKDDNLQSMLLYGTAGRGKTTLAQAVANDMKASTMFINGSLDTSISIIRNRVIQFVSTQSLIGSSSRKVVIIDELEQMSPETLNSLKGIIEQFSKNALFIFTTNYINKVPDPLKSRTMKVNFDVKEDDKKELASQMYKRALAILDNEGIEYDAKTVALVIKNTFPDFRNCIAILQESSSGGELKSSALASNSSYDELISSVIDKKWLTMREWCGSNYQYFEFSRFFNELSKKVEVSSLPEVVILTANYDYKQSFVVDKQLNVVAYLTEVMGVL